MSGKWTPLGNQSGFSSNLMLLLTDGTVICQHSNSKMWGRLTPDPTGSYIHGSWDQIADMKTARMYYASAVLADGRMIVAGGEYNGGKDAVDLLSVEIYDPVRNLWSDLPVPANFQHIGDAPCSVLPDGRFLIGSIESPETAIFNPNLGNWMAGPRKLKLGISANAPNSSSEETWTLLRDGSVLTVDCTKHPYSERCDPSKPTWLSAGETPNGYTKTLAESRHRGPLVFDSKTGSKTLLMCQRHSQNCLV
jgi:Kelch motif